MFDKKDIKISIALADKTFKDKQNIKIIKGLATQATIKKLGLPSKNEAEIVIYNMLDSDMETLTTLAFQPKTVTNNQIEVYAGDGKNYDLVFKGTIVPGGAYADYNSSPTKTFTIKAITAYFESVAPAEPTNQKGGANAAGLIATLGLAAGLAVKIGDKAKNAGLIADPYFTGSAMQQMQKIANAVNAELVVDDGVVVLNGENEARATVSIPLISKDTGMIGYPSFSQTGLDFKTVYNPNIQLSGIVKVKSTVPKATGLWKVLSITHELTSNIPGGAWETEVKTTYIQGVAG